MGYSIELKDFRGNKLNQWLYEKNKQYKSTNIIPRKLSEISKEINESNEDEKYKNISNSLYVNIMGMNDVTTNFDALHIHSDYFQIVCNDDIDANYLCEYFNSKNW